ncbi:hypothetical protein N7495_008110 [Penicillium taxi]|uniref:uncharacterized protein n=1 Tax=Penicillium taxi TaxID=168475 RepID=UPI002544D65D|nr:uncharacterized protein N7495_008110 [Penicillium taxi]KAJ5888069.1 hypothetical protein N7495_008110 [Penicillium taxi]
MSSTAKIALITGATGGIGKATSYALAKEGFSVALHYNAAPESSVKELLDGVKSAASSSSNEGQQVFKAFQANLGDLEAVKRLHKDVVSSMGDPAVVFLNAGSTAGLNSVSHISDITPEIFEQTWRINTASPFLLTQLCLPAMEKVQWGRIIFNSSVAGINGGVIGGHYASSKAALHGLVHWLAGVVAKKGITVNALAPALVEDTAMLPVGGDELAKKIPVGRFGRPEEMANTVVWMVKTAYLTNKVIAVDGGFSYGG